jgi:type I restriction enzyme M protein
MPDHNYFSNLIWQIADLLRGPYRPPQYERVMLPMTVLRRFDCVLAPTKNKVLSEFEKRKGGKLNDDALDRLLNRASGQRFHNHSPLDFEKLKGDPDNIEKHLVSYIKGFSANVRRIFDFFEFENEIEKMRESNILYLVISKFCDVDLHPSAVPNGQMGLIFENLIRRFNELANETAGDHFTPREVIRLMVNILFINDDKLLATPGTVRKLLDPACGTGGMLAEAQNYLRDHHGAAKLYVFGQDYNKRAFATAASDMLMKDVDQNGGTDNVRFGDIFTDDQFTEPPYERFDYLLANPPFGVDWKRQQKEIQREHDKLGFDGRFGAGLPRVNDGALLFLQHMISKFEPVNAKEQKHGSRLAIVFSGSPLFTGGAGSGESEIRKWIIENDWLEAIVALPEQMFYNTGIGTYVFVVTNRKEKRRKGKIQLVDAREFYISMRRSLGDKRRKIGEKEDGLDQIGEIVQLFGRFENSDLCKIFDNADFGYTRLTVERPLRLRYQMTVEDKGRFLDAYPHLLDDVQAIDKVIGRETRLDWNVAWKDIEDVLRKRKSKWKGTEGKLFRSVFTKSDPAAKPVLKNQACEADPDLRDFENVPLKDDVDSYFKREVLPHIPDAWMDRTKDKIGYEINFNRHFYKYTPSRPLEEIDAELKQAEDEIMRLLREVTK